MTTEIKDGAIAVDKEGRVLLVLAANAYNTTAFRDELQGVVLRDPARQTDDQFRQFAIAKRNAWLNVVANVTELIGGLDLSRPTGIDPGLTPEQRRIAELEATVASLVKKSKGE